MFDRDLFGDAAPPDKHGSVLAETWEYPPFSVLNAREGWWQERKRQWLALGIRSELGRGGGNLGDKPGHDRYAQAFDVRGGLQTWQKDKRRNG
jgi:hypothetical protein